MSTMPVATDIHTFDFWERERAERDEAFKWLRANDPVSWHPPAESLLMPPEFNTSGFWAITKHAHIQELSRLPKIFSSASGIFMEDLPPEAYAMLSFITQDAPSHTWLRGIVQTAFSPRNMRTMESWIRGQAHDVVAEMAPKGEADLVVSLTKELPARIYADYLGVDSPELRERVTWAADQLVSWNDPDYTEKLTPIEVFGGAAKELAEIALELAAERRTNLGEDLVSWVLQAEFDGRRMTDEEIGAFFVLMGGAANDTTGHTMANAFILFEQHPEQKALLLEDFEGRIEDAVEEILRFDLPIRHFRRTALEDYEIGGKLIKKGDKVVMWYESGNRDEDVFEDPYALNILRQPNRQLAFGGGGPHFCLGNALARVQLRSAIREVYSQLPDIEVQLGEVKRVSSNFMNNVKSAPARWTPPAAAH